MARRGDLGGAEALSTHAVAPILLASTSPQRRVILEQLGIPFDAVAPDYEEHDPPDADPVQLVREHARGKAQSVARGAGERPVLGVDTSVWLDGSVYGKPTNAGDAERMLEELSGKTHTVVSGLCLLTSGWEVLEKMTTDDRLSEIPVIVLSAMAGERPNRAQGLVRKPFALETLVAAIRGCLPDREGAAAPN